MKFKDFLKDKIWSLMLMIFSVITVVILVMFYNISIYIKIYIIVAPIVAYTIGIIIEFYRKKTFYDTLKENMEQLEQKYLISEIIKEPSFAEGKILKSVIQDTGKSMLENVNKYKYIQQDYKDYIELWIHEVKLPIATSKLIIENNKNEVTKNIEEELDQIENYVEQALYYARSSTVEKDYYINKCILKDIVNTAILKNKSNLILNKINIELENLDLQVYTDSKWCIFILNQIIQNSIKYKKDGNSILQINAKENKENVVLNIKDNGIGIKQEEVEKVFEKGFTGTNGRIDGKKSTGMGLYLCKKLCEKLGLSIEIESKKDKYTQVKITFPKNSYFG